MSAASDGPAQLKALVRSLGLREPGALADPGLGTMVRHARTSWVVRLTCCGEELYVKTYDYASTAARWRGALRNTGPFCPSRAAREAAAATWLAAHGFAAAPVRGWIEFRRFGFVRRAILVTGAVPGRRVDECLATVDAALRAGIAAAIGHFVGRLHRLGFRDRNLDLRNLLLLDDPSGLRLCKIDSPRFRLLRPGPPADRLADEDWARLLPQLEPFGIAGIAVRAAAQIT